MLLDSVQGSEQQKQELLPKMATLEYVGCWALTEVSYAAHIQASLSLTSICVRIARTPGAKWRAFHSVCVLHAVVPVALQWV
jgi:hypothetical protein